MSKSKKKSKPSDDAVAVGANETHNVVQLVIPQPKITAEPRTLKPAIRGKSGPRKCRCCSTTLRFKHEGHRGRPPEFCAKCRVERQKEARAKSTSAKPRTKAKAAPAAKAAKPIAKAKSARVSNNQ